MDDPPVAPLAVDTRAPSPSTPVAATAEPARSEWASPRARGRRGTPPPVPRRASRTEDEIAGVAVAATEVALPPRPRTPAQVLASRAAAAKAAVHLADAMAPDSREEASETATRGSEGRDAVGAYTKEDVAELVGGTDDSASAAGDGEDPRRTSVQLSAVGSEQYYASDAEDGESLRRDDRVDTSTVDEESMYNDDEDDDDDGGGDGDHDDDDGDGEYDDGDNAHESPGTSDSYVKIHDERDDDDDNERDGEEDEEQQEQMGEESLTPDNTPPPSPPRLVQPLPQRHRHTQEHQVSAPAVTEWIKYVAESGHEYYFNTHTQVSQWTRPSAMVLSPRSGAIMDEVHTEGEEGPEEENQLQHGGGMADEMPPQLYVQTPLTYQQQQATVPYHQQQQLAVDPSQYQSSLPPTNLENLFAAAARNDETAQLQAILRYDVEVNAVNASGLTPLHVAVQHGNARGAAMLLDYGALVDGASEDSGMVLGGVYAAARLTETPLVMACRTNHASLVRLLVRYGASIYTRDNDGNTVLHIAIRCWSDEVLSCLLEMDSVAAIINQRNADDETPLHLAARHGNANAVKALISAGASVDVEDAQGRTPLVVSIMENRVDCAQLLQEVGHSDGHRSSTIPDSSNGPMMYDSNPKLEEATARQESDELEGIRLYLMQLLKHAATDGVLVSTIYQYMDAVQREITAMASSAAESRQREETLLAQIDELTNHESITASELAKEREENERLHQQLDAKEVELNSVQAAFDSLSSRSTMLESIARSAQDKLRRERAEFARQEEYWNQTIDNSLRENAALLESVQALQQGWQGHSGARETSSAHMPGEAQAATSNEEYEDSYDALEHPSDYGGISAQGDYESYQGYYYTSAQSEQAYDVNQPRYTDAQYVYPDPTATSKKAASSTPSAKSEPERPISPERVDAVWNRFFENVSRVAEAGDTPSQHAPQEKIPSLRQNAAPVSVLPPASAVFDSIRKTSKDRLHQLLLSGISPNIRDLGEKGTPLHLASELGDLESVMLLCEFGADLEIRDENGSTPLLVACSQGHYECTKFLLQSAANQAAMNANRDSALHLAAWDGSFECVEILLEYGVDVMARNSLGLTALANLKTRSPLRHRFEDLSRDHPMEKTLMILEEAERFEQAEEVQGTRDLAQKVPKTPSAVSVQTVKNPSDTKAQTVHNTSWSRWILGSVFGSYNDGPPAEAPNNSEGEDDDNRSDFEEAESSPSKLRAARLQDYEDLRPPPEIEAALRRKPLSPSASDPLPPLPPEVLDALEKRKLGGSSTFLSPSSSATRFAFPASTAPPATKKSASSTPTNVRSRYVDTFNSPS